MIKLNMDIIGIMRKDILTTNEQFSLYQKSIPFLEAITDKVAKMNGGKDMIRQTALLWHEKPSKSALSGGYKSLNLGKAWESLPKTPELLRAKRAQEELIVRTTPMVVKEAAKYYRGRKCSNTQGDDYAQMGSLAVTYAYYLYTPISPKTGKPVKFSTYAKPWIEALIREEQQKSTLIYDKRRKDMAPRFYTEVRDESGDYVDIFTLIDYIDEPSISQVLFQTRDGKTDFAPYIKKLLTPQELTALTMSPSSPIEASLMLGLPLTDDCVNQAKEFKSAAIDKLKEILEDSFA